jgi:hypothetical protein
MLAVLLAVFTFNSVCLEVSIVEHPEDWLQQLEDWSFYCKLNRICSIGEGRWVPAFYTYNLSYLGEWQFEASLGEGFIRPHLNQ